MTARRKTVAETPEANQRAVEPVETAAEATPARPATVDRVAMVSRRADGTPDQSDGYEVILDEDR